MIDRIAVVKPGMEKFLETLGVPSCYVQNIVPFDRAAVHPTNVDNVVGLWLSGSSEYRKRPYSALLALAGLPQVTLRASGLGELGCRMIEELGLRTVALFPEPIPHERVIHEMRQTSLTLYVTLSECMPMVPLESISCGVPCIVGPATRFYDIPYLTERLVVNNPTDPRAIRRQIISVLDEYDEVMHQSLEFLDRLTEHAAEKLTRFLS
jgi:glycosyltransferase involved in cell wall biosynthesis